MKKLLRAIGCAAALGAGLAAPILAQTTFRKYVALGDSLTAGVEGNCLVERNQQRSYPKLVADALGIADFQQPLLSERALTSPPGNVCLGAVEAGGRITVGAVSQMGAPTNATLPRPYDNLGIPGANAADLVDLRVANPNGNTANRFAALVLRNFPGGPFEGRNAVDEANLLEPDLVTVWIGNNDVLGAALSGAAIDGVTLTPVSVFEAKYTQLMAGLRATMTGTVVALNIPDVAAIPFTTTIPAFVVNPTTGARVTLLGPRATATCSTPPCPLPEGTLVTLGASPLLGLGVGVPTTSGGTGLPLPDGSFSPPSTLNAGVLLYPDEVALIRARTDELNARIALVAGAHGATVLDIHAIFDEIAARGYDVGGGIVLTRNFLTGGIFSADGFHASNIGYAIVATEVIEHLNEVADADLELPDLAQTLFEPNEPAISAAGIADPDAGPFGYSTQSWKDLVFSTGSPPAELELSFPAAKRPRVKSFHR